MLLNKKIPFKYIINKIKRELIIVIIIAILVKISSLYFKNIIPEMPLSIPAFLGTSISVLLSFKLNQSYDRWWEARKIWGAIVNDSRTLVLQLQSFLDDKNNLEIRQIALRQIAWCYSLGQSLRDLNPIDNIQNLITPKDLDQLNRIGNKPLGLLQQNTLQIASLKKSNNLTDYQHVQITNTLGRFSDSMGMAERINNTVFPATYRKFLHLVIYIFVITLSLALGDISVIYELPLLIVISSSFFLLEKTATHMQDPFSNKPSDTAVTTIARTIEINLKEMINEPSVPEPFPANKFYRL